MFYPSILYIKIIYLPRTQQIYKCTASGSCHHPRTNNHRYNHRHNNNHYYNHRHKLQPQSPDPPTNSKSKNLNKIK